MKAPKGKIIESKRSLLTEHKKLVRILTKATPTQRKAEAKKQAEELKHFK